MTTGNPLVRLEGNVMRKKPKMQNRNGTAVVLLSGGQDSTTVLYDCLNKFDKVRAVSIYYGQRHDIELASAQIIAGQAGVHLEEVPLPREVLRSTSPLLSGLPVAQYEGVSDLPGGLEATFVPLRNLLFLTIAMNRAVALNADCVAIGVSQEDFGGYPDCRATFLRSFEEVTREAIGANDEVPAADRSPMVYAPLLHKSKADTVRHAADLGAQAWDALSWSHTCYVGSTPPCLKCHSCILRAKGFHEAGQNDPLLVRLRTAGLYRGDSLTGYLA